MYSVLKGVFALTINTDIHFSYIFLHRTKMPLILRPSNVNKSAKQIWAYPKPFSNRSSRPIFWSFLCSYSQLGVHLIHHSGAIWLCCVLLHGRCSNLSSTSVAYLRENFSVTMEAIIFTQLCVINQHLHHREHSYSGWCFSSIRFNGVSNSFFFRFYR
jgi:hypothetical protein